MSIKDEFLKAKLITKKDVKQLEHESRVEKKRLGTEGLQAQEQQRQKELQQKLDEQKLRDQQLARQQAQERLDKEKERNKVNIEELIKNAEMDDHGPRKFFFITRNKKIPYISVSDGMGEKLERGIAAIVEYPTPIGSDFAIVNRQCAEKLSEIDPEAVRFFNREPLIRDRDR